MGHVIVSGTPVSVYTSHTIRLFSRDGVQLVLNSTHLRPRFKILALVEMQRYMFNQKASCCLVKDSQSRGCKCQEYSYSSSLLMLHVTRLFQAENISPGLRRGGNTELRTYIEGGYMYCST